MDTFGFAAPVKRKLSRNVYASMKRKNGKFPAQKPTAKLISQVKYNNGEPSTVYHGYLLDNVREDKSSVFLPMTFLSSPTAPLTQKKTPPTKGNLLIFNDGFEDWSDEEHSSNENSSIWSDISEKSGSTEKKNENNTAQIQQIHQPYTAENVDQILQQNLTNPPQNYLIDQSMQNEGVVYSNIVSPINSNAASTPSTVSEQMVGLVNSVDGLEPLMEHPTSAVNQLDLNRLLNITAEAQEAGDINLATTVIEHKKKKGRPKGSKNKTKEN